MDKNTASQKHRAELMWVPIDHVIPNPLNPRKDARVNSDELQAILKSRGWEEGLTVYKKGAYYVLLSGHRRWHSARAMGMKEVPIYVTEAPLSDQEEVERIASLQLAHKEWTMYEWAKFCYDSWVYWGKPTYSDFSVIIHLSKEKISEYVSVFEYYPRDEIEDKLEKRVYSIRVLAVLVRWMKRFKQYHPQLMHQMTEQMVRRMMLKKAERKRLEPNTLKGDRFVEVADSEQMREFLVTPDMSIRQAQSLVGVDNIARTGYWQSTVQKISYMVRDIPSIKPRDREQAQNMTKYLNMLIQQAEKKRSELVGMYADSQMQVQLEEQDEQKTFYSNDDDHENDDTLVQTSEEISEETVEEGWEHSEGTPEDLMKESVETVDTVNVAESELDQEHEIPSEKKVETYQNN